MLYNALGKKGEVVDINLDNLISKAQHLFPKTVQTIKQIHARIDDGKFDDAYSGLLGLTSVLKEEAGTPCIVILDEFDNLEHLGVKNPFLSFGKVIMVQKDTMYIVSSSRNTAIRKIITEKLSLLFGNFEVIKVSNFGARASCLFIDAKLAGFEVNDFVRKLLITFTDGNPFYLDRLVSSIRTIAASKMTNYIDNDIVAGAILDSVYSSDGSIHQYLMNYLLDLLDTKHKDFYTAVLVAIASGNNKQAGIAKAVKTKPGDVAKALTYLLERALISKNGVFYKIDDVMFEFWLRAVYQRRRDILVDGTFNRRELFSSEITSHIASFEKEFAEDTTSRLAGLFSVFSNELVELEMKNIRLPHFTQVDVRAFGDAQRFIAASFKENLWIAQAYDRTVNENDIVSFVKNVKTLDHKISHKVILPLKGIDENAKLLAKELRISIWDSTNINMLLSLYGKKRIIAL